MNGLWPREHGAYAQLGFPLVTGLWLAGAAPGAVAFAVAAVALFLAREPLVVVLGVRGIRVRDLLVQAARRRLWFLAVVMGLALVAAVVLVPLRAWMAAAVPGLLAVGPFLFADRVKTLAGELVVAAAFSASVMPLVMTVSAAWGPAWAPTLVWFGVFAPSILSVHAVKAAHKGRPSARWLVPAAPILALVVVGVGLLVGLATPQPWGRALAVLPPALAVLGVAAVRPHPRHLKRIGWTMVAAYAGTLILLLG